MQGPDRPDTITARGNLASAYHSARKADRGAPLYERTLADCERVLGRTTRTRWPREGNRPRLPHGE